MSISSVYSQSTSINNNNNHRSNSLHPSSSTSSTLHRLPANPQSPISLTTTTSSSSSSSSTSQSQSSQQQSQQPQSQQPQSQQCHSSTTTSPLRHQPQSLHSSQLSHVLPLSQHHLSHYQQHTAQLAAYITQIFLPSVLPTAEEYQIKEQTRQYLETLADKVSPGARLLPFGSIASGLALRNSDMDLCCLIDHTEEKPTSPKPSSNAEDQSTQADPSESQESQEPQEPKLTTKPVKQTPAEMVLILGKLIQEETSFMVKMLPKARIPIIKLSLPPSAGQPFGLSCDIGFENRLALENTRLLLTYAMVDPRMRTIVLFLKVWTKRRRINDPYLGTLSSYGYVLLVIYYLVNGRKDAVLPNLQQLPPPRPSPPEELIHDGHSIYFFDDLDALPRYWTGTNRENVGELLIDFFRFFASTFRYTHDVVSIRSIGGLLSKEHKGWMQDIIEEGGAVNGGRSPYAKVDLNRLCIEDPFQINYNVARTVTRDGLFTIRGEFMRAVRVLSTRTDRLDVMIRELCEERQEGVLMAPPSSTGRRKSAPNPKLPSSASQSPHINDFQSPPARKWGSGSQEPGLAQTSTSNGISNDPLEEDEDDFQQQLLLQQQQQEQHQAAMRHAAAISVPTYPPLTARLMQDHVYRQATTSTDARPRYPPESIASEPAPLDRDLDWQHHPHLHHDSINYLANEIHQLQLRQQLQQQQQQQQLLLQQQQQQEENDKLNESTALKPADATDTKPSTDSHTGPNGNGINYFHRFFQSGGSSSSSSGVQSTSSSNPQRTIYETKPNYALEFDHHHHSYPATTPTSASTIMPDFSNLPISTPIRFGNFSTTSGTAGYTNGTGNVNGRGRGKGKSIENGEKEALGKKAGKKAVKAEGNDLEEEQGGAEAEELPSKIVFGDVEVTTSTNSSNPTTTNGTHTNHSHHNNHHHNHGHNHNHNHHKRKERVKALATVLRSKRVTGAE
ncbi:uncharacterized protein MELLADRAFT_112216 [Melampsora larici-populina 98AG31]|uniref:polynucleotide adenylyltransferase n=1 Tax=Melampsora larici-populina (strain 98AG31 / pathotype 3-4-7) TaxID=747676 RepID=F4S5R4_MELLP|nr:uncharacterized protein MELLADRAFT_112216 [Melampsora larici-populina 98AG31]EGF99944.1 hypothetical protein MELLADRAFT_112216 [Melampsora larici-populina 98AG31]